MCATAQYLLYDGHGSSRQLAQYDGTDTITIQDGYNYDGYGVMLGTDNTAAANAATSMLYAGEQYDSGLDMYYNRARYYNQNNGTFNRVDPYAGNNQDPQSLHKYAYCHNNPIMGIDPTGMFNITSTMIVNTIRFTLMTLNLTSAVGNIRRGISYTRLAMQAYNNGEPIVCGAYSIAAVLSYGMAIWSVLSMFAGAGV